jgi:hypothetical protein
LRGLDGGLDATALVGAAPVAGVIKVLGAILLAAALSIPASKLFGSHFALNTAGWVLVWAAWRTGTVDDLMFAGGAGIFTKLAAEGLIVGAAGIGLIYAINKVGQAADAEILTHKPHAQHLTDDRKAQPIPSILAAAAVGGILAWVFAFGPLKGHAVFAAVLAGIGTGAASQLASVSASQAKAVFFAAAGLALLAVVGPLSAMWQPGNIPDARAAANGSISHLALLTPLDWLAGGLIGIPLGVSWSLSTVERKTVKAT